MTMREITKLSHTDIQQNKFIKHTRKSFTILLVALLETYEFNVVLLRRRSIPTSLFLCDLKQTCSSITISETLLFHGGRQTCTSLPPPPLLSIASLYLVELHIKVTTGEDVDGEMG